VVPCTVECLVVHQTRMLAGTGGWAEAGTLLVALASQFVAERGR
jgi:hypothetical protein